MSRLMLKSAKRASLIENLRSLRGLGKMRVRGSGSCLANGERRLEKWKLLVSLEAPKALGGFLHGRACPTQSHRRRAPVFYVPADAPHRAHDILDDVRAGERTPQFRRQSELCYGEHLVEPFQDRGGNALPVLFEMPGKVAKKRLGLAGVGQLPGLPQPAPPLCMHRFRQAVHDVACFMYLTALNGHVASESRSDRLGESLRAVDDEKARQGGIEAALDEIIDQRLHGRCVFCGALDQPKRMFVAVRINADRRHQGRDYDEIHWAPCFNFPSVDRHSATVAISLVFPEILSL